MICLECSGVLYEIFGCSFKISCWKCFLHILGGSCWCEKIKLIWWRLRHPIFRLCIRDFISFSLLLHSNSILNDQIVERIATTLLNTLTKSFKIDCLYECVCIPTVISSLSNNIPYKFCSHEMNAIVMCVVHSVVGVCVVVAYCVNAAPSNDLHNIHT